MVYVVINIQNFSVEVFTTKKQIADLVKCHRNSLLNLDERMTVGDYIIIPAKVIKCKKGYKH